MRSVMKHQFSQVPKADIQRSTFDRSHGYKTTFDAGWLVPFYVDEALPGDTFSLKASIFARMATPIVPLMDNLHMDTFFFAVPIRLIWDNWQKFNGEQENPGDSTDYLVPQVTAPSGGWPVGSLSDYFGLPTGKSNLSVSAFWHRAYNLIWNEWFRDENLQDSVTVPKGDGPDPDNLFTLLKRGKRHDYFTSCLPWPQKGVSDIDIPIGGATVNFPSKLISISANGTPTFKAASGVGVAGSAGHATFGGTVSTSSAGTLGYTTSATGPHLANVVWSNPALVFNQSSLEASANLDAVEGFSINQLREAFQVQRLLERDARGGTRYVEILRSHFGVVSPDARLQRPEYLGGSSAHIRINPVQQTSSTDSTSPQGNLAAFGVAADTFHGFTKGFLEHCVIIGLVNIWADLTYQQGINRMFSRRTRFDFYWPSLAHLGEQEVLNKEIYAQGNAEFDDAIFGYQERYAEYRYFPSQITGKFRSTYAQPLDIWHLSQKFDNLPTLSSQFIQENPPIDRVVAVPSEPDFLFDSYIKLKCTRPMPIYGVPGFVDHF